MGWGRGYFVWLTKNKKKLSRVLKGKKRKKKKKKKAKSSKRLKGTVILIDNTNVLSSKMLKGTVVLIDNTNVLKVKRNGCFNRQYKRFEGKSLFQATKSSSTVDTTITSQKFRSPLKSCVYTL